MVSHNGTSWELDFIPVNMRYISMWTVQRRPWIVMQIVFLTVLTLILGSPIAAQPVGCGPSAAKYAELNRQLIVENKTDAHDIRK